MSTILQSSGMEGTVATALRQGTGPLTVDETIKSETLEIIYPGEAPRSVGDVAVAAYNGVDCNFDIYPPDGTRVRFAKSYLRFEYIATDISGAPAMAVVDSNYCSISWNPIAACVDSCSFSLNAANVEIERYSNDFGHGNMIKLLTQYSREAIESSHDRFFTPCMESTRDLSTALSAESSARSLRWFSYPTVPATVNRGAKNIMLGDMFDSLRVDAAWYVKRARITVQFKDASKILFRSYQSTAAERFYIVGLELHIIYDLLTSSMIKEEMGRLERNEVMMRQLYLSYETDSDTHSSDKTYRTNGITNMIAGVLLFPAGRSLDNLYEGVCYANPYQYTYGLSAAHGDGVSSYQHQYNGIYSPRNSLAISAPYRMRNTALYEQYRLLAQMVDEPQVAPCVSFLEHMAQYSPTYDRNCYVMFASPFFDLTTNPTLTPRVSDHIIKTSGGGSGNGVVIVRLRVMGVEVLANNSVNRLN